MTKTGIHKNYYRITILLLSMLLFLLACWAYICFRSSDMVLYSWLGVEYNNSFFELLRIADSTPAPWLIYNLPDCLWLLSFLLLMECVWDKSKLKWIFVFGMISFAYVLELLQCLQLFPGTGDVWDFVCYTIAIVIYLFIHKLKFIFHEKSC